MDERLERLRAVLRKTAPALIAVSGGIDSRLLAWVARDTGLAFRAVHFQGPHQSPDESTRALSWLGGLSGLGLPYHILPLSPLDAPDARANTRERCYHCKRMLFRRAADLARDLSGEGTFLRLLDGTNADDAASFRPGLRALRECGVRSPLAEAGLGKADIRDLARLVGLDDPDQPARACLMTRFAYGIAPTRDLLALAGRGEDALYGLGLCQLRLRVPRLGPDGAPVFELHLAPEERTRLHGLHDRVHAALAACGIHVDAVLFPETLSGVYDTPGTGGA
ncbi:MAG: asparagine synthase [Desulfovibrionaceae bacterium]